MIKQLLLFLFFGVSSFVFGQKAESKLSVNTVSVGEQFTYTIEIECKESDQISYKSNKNGLIALRSNPNKESPDTLKLEVLSELKSKKEKIQGKIYWEGNFSLICFDTGYLVIPPVSIEFNGKPIEVPPALLRVNLVPKNKNIDLYDIEENFAVLPDPDTDWVNWAKIIGLWILVIASIAALIYFTFIKGKEKNSTVQEEDHLNSKEKTRQALIALMEKKMWRNEQEKEHFTELSLIIRRFLNDEFNNRFEGKTSFEIQFILRNEHFSSKHLTNLGLILNVSDMVKFAKSSVEEEGILVIYQKAVEFVNELEIK